MSLSRDASFLNLKKASTLPPESFFENARGVLQRSIAVTITPKDQKFKSKSWDSARVYLVIDNGFIFVYLTDKFGYAVDVKEAESIEKDENTNTISLQFRDAELKLDFGTLDEVFAQWWMILNALQLGGDELQKVIEEYALDAYPRRLKYILTAKRDTNPWSDPSVILCFVEEKEDIGPAPYVDQASSNGSPSSRPPRRQWAKWPYLENEPVEEISFAHPTPARQMAPLENFEDEASEQAIKTPPGTKTPPRQAPSAKDKHKQSKTPVRRQRDAAEEAVPPPLQFDDDAEGEDDQAASMEAPQTPAPAAVPFTPRRSTRTRKPVKPFWEQPFLSDQVQKTTPARIPSFKDSNVKSAHRESKSSVSSSVDRLSVRPALLQFDDSEDDEVFSTPQAPAPAAVSVTPRRSARTPKPIKPFLEQ